MAYPVYGKKIETYTDTSMRQLVAVITQNGGPIAFFSQKLSNAQTKYSVTEQELLSIVECLKEFKSMLRNQKIKVYTNQQNLARDALGLTPDWLYRLHLVLEEFSPKNIYILGITNALADAMSHLEYGKEFK